MQSDPSARIRVIAVDGPGGTGKGTLCAALAAHLGWHLLDSGALYRVLALAATQAGLSTVAPEAENRLAALARTMPLQFLPGDAAERVRVVLDGADVTAEIRSEWCGNLASEVAALPSVRAALFDRQTAFRRAPGLVADGRDMGTVVFSDADLKIFLTASPEERARRRHKQLIEKGINANLPQLLDDIVRRDARDAQRSVSPLKPAPDAVVIDTTGLDVAAVQARVMSLLRANGLTVAKALH